MVIEERTPEQQAMDRDPTPREPDLDLTRDEETFLRVARSYGASTPAKASNCCETCDLIYRETYVAAARSRIGQITGRTR